jgi:hypothetical protein
MQVRAATFFGSESPESFVDVVEISDGSVVAVGNAYGPAFPNSPKPVVLGEGAHTGAEICAAKCRNSKSAIVAR